MSKEDVAIETAEAEAAAKAPYWDPPPAPLLDTSELKKWSLYRALIAEFMATLIFLYVSVATVIGYKRQSQAQACAGVGFLGIAWSFGATIFILVYCTGGISDRDTISMPAEWMDFFIMMLLNSASSEWAKKFLNSPAWSLIAASHTGPQEKTHLPNEELLMDDVLPNKERILDDPLQNKVSVTPPVKRGTKRVRDLGSTFCKMEPASLADGKLLAKPSSKGAVGRPKKTKKKGDAEAKEKGDADASSSKEAN